MKKISNLMKLKSKIIIVVSLMLFSSFFIIPSTVTANTPASSPFYTGFNNLTISTSYENYTLPNYNYVQFDSVMDRSANLVGNLPIFTRDNVMHQTGFVYINTSNDLVFYNIGTKSVKLLYSNFPQVTQTGRSFYGLRNWLHYYQLPNGSLYDVWTVGLYPASSPAGNFIINVYNFYTNSFYGMATNFSGTNGEIFSVYQITNYSFWFSNVANSANGLGTDMVSYPNFLGYDGRVTYASTTNNFTFEGLACDDSLFNSAFAGVSSIIMAQCQCNFGQHLIQCKQILCLLI